MAGYGQLRYGTDGYNAPPLAAALVPTAPEAIATRVVRVQFGADVMSRISSNAGDALNPATWIITRLDNNAVLTTLAVEKIDERTFNITTMEPFGSAQVQHQLFISGLYSADGTSSISQFLLFAGVVAFDESTPERKAGSRRYASIDIDNPPVRAGYAPGGTLVVTAAGDYATVTGRELVKKLLLRRLTTRRGEFWHLGGDYGLAPELKSPLNISALPKLKADIERQSLLEPEVMDARAVLLADDSGTVVVQLFGRLKQSGESISLSFPARQTTV